MMIAPLFISMINILINHTMLTKKRSNLYCFIAFIINTLVVLVITMYIRTIDTNPIIYKYLTYLTAFSYIGYITIVFSDIFSIKLFSMFSTWVFSTIILLISKMVYDLVGGYTVNVNVINATSIALHLLLFIRFYKLYGKYFKTTLKKINYNVIYLISGYMFLALILLINAASWNGQVLSNAIPNLEMLLLIIFMILGYLIVFFGISSSSKNASLKQNVDTLKKQSDIYYNLANYDALTCIANRASIMNHISEKLDNNKNEEFVLIMFDIDKFKLVNDKYGHLTGDKVLKFLVSRVKNCLREDDFIGRLGGDEFIILSNGIHAKKDAECLIKRIISSLESPLKIEEDLIYIDISMGVSIYPSDGILMDDLLEKADQAMYKAKEKDGSTYEFFDK